MDESDPSHDLPPDLLQRIYKRDPAALAEYFDLNRGQLAGFVRAITGDHLLAIVEVDDLLQEDFHQRDSESADSPAGSLRTNGMAATNRETSRG